MIKADADVVKELQELEKFFYNTVVRVRRWLDLHKCNLSDAQLYLNGVSGTNDFSSCNSFGKIMEKLQQDHIAIFNTFMLEGLVECFNRDELTEIVLSYEKKKQSFLSHTSVRSFHHAVVSRVESVLPKGKAVVTITVPEKMATRRTLKDIEELAKEGFKEHYNFFVQFHARAGCIIISWVFPEARCDELAQLACRNAAIFKNAGVEEVTVGGRRVYPVSQQVKIFMHT